MKYKSKNIYIRWRYWLFWSYIKSSSRGYLSRFADNLALLTEEIEQAQEVLRHLENEAENICLYYIAKETENVDLQPELLVEVKLEVVQLTVTQEY